ncbi:MAG: hypothetical protein QOJ45_6 [Verrucomicrobiota bacterium]|jgi:hypothetical protein
MQPEKSQSEGSSPKQEFFRLPIRGAKDELFGLPRATYLRLEREGLIKFVRVLRPGCNRGSVLVQINSVREYLNSLTTAK